MTPKTLKAGRELDAEIAEKVMGLIVSKNRKYCSSQANKNGGLAGIILESVPDYSTSIADAFSVVEKMKADGWRFCLGVVAEGSAAVFTKDDKFDGMADYHTTTPLAIVSAALKAVGEKS